MTQTIDISERFDELNVGDVINVPQYKQDLRINHDGREAGLLGVEFVGNQNGTNKHLIQNEHSGRVYLVAGSTDKGEVTEIDLVQEAV